MSALATNAPTVTAGHKPRPNRINNQIANTPAVSNVIREARAFMLPGIIQTGRKQGMQLMDDALIDLRKQGLISAEEALARADQKEIVRQHIAK